jgi:hypothetical protein
VHKSDIFAILIYARKGITLTALNFVKLCPFVLLLKVSWGKEGKLMRSALRSCAGFFTSNLTEKHVILLYENLLFPHKSLENDFHKN